MPEKSLSDFLSPSCFKHFKGWIDKESVTVMGWVWAIEEMDTVRNDLVVFEIPKETDVKLEMVRKIEQFISEQISSNQTIAPTSAPQNQSAETE